MSNISNKDTWINVIKKDNIEIFKEMCIILKNEGIGTDGWPAYRRNHPYQYPPIIHSDIIDLRTIGLSASSIIDIIVENGSKNILKYLIRDPDSWDDTGMFTTFGTILISRVMKDDSLHEILDLGSCLKDPYILEIRIRNPVEPGLHPRMGKMYNPDTVIIA